MLTANSGKTRKQHDSQEPQTVSPGSVMGQWLWQHVLPMLWQRDDTLIMHTSIIAPQRLTSQASLDWSPIATQAINGSSGSARHSLRQLRADSFHCNRHTQARNKHVCWQCAVCMTICVLRGKQGALGWPLSACAPVHTSV